MLAYQYIAGATARQVREAARRVQRAGSGAGLAAGLAPGSTSLRRLGPTRALALEIALNHAVEQHAFVQELYGVHATWRVEDALAGIVDDELS